MFNSDDDDDSKENEVVEGDKNTKFGHGLDGVGAEAENQYVDLRNMPKKIC
jgi:hypothetical protein